MYCGSRRSLRHFAVFICLDPSAISSCSITLPSSLLFPGNSLLTARRLRLVAAKPVSPAARSPRGLLPLLAAPLPKNLAPAMFSGALFDIVVAPRPQPYRSSHFIPLPFPLLFPSNSLLTARRLRLVAAKHVSLAARFPRGLLPSACGSSSQKPCLRNVFGSPF